MQPPPHPLQLIFRIKYSTPGLMKGKQKMHNEEYLQLNYTYPIYIVYQNHNQLINLVAFIILALVITIYSVRNFKLL